MVKPENEDFSVPFSRDVGDDTPVVGEGKGFLFRGSTPRQGGEVSEVVCVRSRTAVTRRRRSTRDHMYSGGGLAERLGVRTRTRRGGVLGSPRGVVGGVFPE